MRFAQRGRIRRRLREIEEEREALLWDLGGLALEMHKRDRFEPGLLAVRAEAVARLDAEAAGLRDAISRRRVPETEEREKGIPVPPGSQPQ